MKVIFICIYKSVYVLIHGLIVLKFAVGPCRPAVYCVRAIPYLNVCSYIYEIGSASY